MKLLNGGEVLEWLLFHGFPRQFLDNLVYKAVEICW